MKPMRLEELQAFVRSDGFLDWWNRLVGARRALGEAEGAHEALLTDSVVLEFRAELIHKRAIDTLYRSGEHDDAAATMLYDANDLENRSFRGVSDFEEQRIRVSEIWYALCAAEKEVEEAQAKTAPERATAERQREVVAGEYEREQRRKQQLWEEVERIWARSAEVSLLMGERRVQGRKVRREAERLFGLAEEHKGRARDLKSRKEDAARSVERERARSATLMASAREEFGCTPGHEFLFFRHRDEPKEAYAVALVDDADTYNIDVRALTIYSVDRQRGVSFLEPARASSSTAEEGDARFERYFLSGRKAMG